MFISPTAPKEITRNFLATLDFNELDRHSLIYRNTRNAVYRLVLGAEKEQILLKRARPSPEYATHRTVSFYLRNFFKNYGKRGHRGAELLRSAGLNTHTPLAYWKISIAPLVYESCFLCYEVPHDFSIQKYCDLVASSKVPEEQLFAEDLCDAMALLVGEVHRYRLLHGDLIANNVLVSISPEGEYVGQRSGKRFSLTIIDTDHMRRNLLPTQFLRRFISLRCFRRLRMNREERREFLFRYFEGSYSPFWFYTLEFWRWLDKRPLSQARRAGLRTISGLLSRKRISQKI